MVLAAGCNFEDYTIMKKITVFFAIVCMAFFSCTEDDAFNTKYSAAKVGDEIAFGGSMQYKSNGKQTRTVYGAKHDGYTDVKWYAGDMVRIYCEQTMDANLETGKRNYCDYEVTGDNVVGTTENPTSEILADGLHEVDLKNASEMGNGLRWGTTGEHKFYGVYPSPAMLAKYPDDKVAANALKIENNKVSAYLPNLQRPARYVAPVEFDNNGVAKNMHIIHPAMRYAYMVAYDKASPADGGVELVFTPIVTAVEMTLENMGDETINGITMISLTSDQILCGAFTTTIEGTPTITNTTTDDAAKTVSVAVAASGSSISLGKGDRLRFTVFMTLNTDIDKLGVSIVYADGLAVKKATLTGNGVKIVQAKKKNFVNVVPVNFEKAVHSVDIANWMAALPDNTPLSGLSIPGAGGASSGQKNEDNYIVSNYARQQNLSIKELWKNGIRCFEFFVDKGSSTDNFKEQIITCNGVQTGVKLIDAVNEVSSLILNNPQEFAVVIIGYEEAYNEVTNYTRNAGRDGFGDNFNNWWSSYEYSEKINEEFKSIAKDKILLECTTLSEARGKLFCIGRPVSIGIDPGWYTGIYSDNNSQDLNCLYILGWGNNPDQWYARGFGNLVVSDYQNSSTIPAGENTADRPYALSTTASGLTAPSYTSKATVSYYTDSNKGTATMQKYIYKATQKTHVKYSDAEYNVMVQEWRRVMPNAEIQTQYNLVSPAGKAFKGLNNSSTDYYSAWSPSVDEKWNDVVKTFIAATNKTGNYNLYINSLCGYFIDGNIALSYQPRPTFQRFYNNKGWLSGKWYSGVYLDDKFRNYGSDSDAPGADLSSKTSPSTSKNWGPYNPLGGYQGNIEAYANWINNRFYNYLLGTTISGSTGIIMMDRVSDNANENPAGYYIPRIILANNPFPEGSGIEKPKALSISFEDEELDLDNSDGVADILCAPAKR